MQGTSVYVGYDSLTGAREHAPRGTVRTSDQLAIQDHQQEQQKRWPCGGTHAKAIDPA
jgi:hypothetical protein